VSRSPSTAGAWLFPALVAGQAALRLVELGVSARNERRTSGERAAASRYPLMVAAHCALFAAPLIEVRLRRRTRFDARWAGLLVATNALRWWVIATLGRRWNTRAIVPGDLTPATDGPYRFVRHPNYIAVALEFLSLPMAGGATISALALSLLDAAILFDRIREEERLLSRNQAWRRAFARRARLIPGIF
jgi:methyltransferase